MTELLTKAMVQEASSRLHGMIHTTPLIYSSFFSHLAEANIYLKLENMQKTGSFKIRGAYNKIASLTEEQKKHGVIAASAGNHAQGVAYAATKADIPCTIVMPMTAPLTKIVATRGYGAKVILWGEGYDEAYQQALAIQEKSGATFVHGFDDLEIMAGQGTVAWEMMEQMPCLEAVLIPAGGGGLLAGVAYALKSRNPAIKVIGVQSREAPGLYQSFKQETLTPKPTGKTIADGICVKVPGQLTTEIIKAYVDDMILVQDEEIAMTILALLERSKIVVEGAGASALAAAVRKLPGLKGLHIGVIISGGNIDVNTVSNIIGRGLLYTHRRLKIKTILPDRPGSLAGLLTLLSQLRANVISVNHDRIGKGMSLKDSLVELVIEVEGKAHKEEIVQALTKHEYSIHALS